MANEVNTKLITGKVRLSYANIWEAKEDDNGVPKYSTSILLPKDDKETLRKYITYAKQNTRPKLQNADYDKIATVTFQPYLPPPALLPAGVKEAVHCIRRHYYWIFDSTGGVCKGLVGFIMRR